MNTYRCGHAKTEENTHISDGYPRCLCCRRELERRASRRYRERHAA